MPALPANPTIPGQLAERAIVTTCAATTNSPSSVPAYASFCSGTVRYSSACSCAGITAATTTVPQQTVTTTSTSTVLVTPTSTVTVTTTNTVTTSTTSTIVIPTTLTTTDATAISLTTTTTTVLATSTVTVAPIQTCYNFKISGGPRDGQYLTANDPSNNPGAVGYSFITFTSDSTKIKSWKIRSDSKVYDGAQNVFGWTTRNNALYYILEMNDYSQSQYRINYVNCAVVSGSLSCTFDNGTPTNLVSCANQGVNLLQAPNVAGAGNGCYALNVQAVPASC